MGATKVVFAYHSEDPVSSADMKQHEFRGAKTILLLNSMDKRDINETGWSKFNLATKNVRNKNALTGNVASILVIRLLLVFI